MPERTKPFFFSISPCYVLLQLIPKPFPPAGTPSKGCYLYTGANGWRCPDWRPLASPPGPALPPAQVSRSWHTLSQRFTDLCGPHNHQEPLLERRVLGPTPRGSDSAGLKWGPRLSIPNRFPGDADVAGLGTTLGEQPFLGACWSLRRPAEPDGLFRGVSLGSAPLPMMCPMAAPETGPLL